LGITVTREVADVVLKALQLSSKTNASTKTPFFRWQRESAATDGVTHRRKKEKEQTWTLGPKSIYMLKKQPINTQLE
jgi:hypothetical protein